MRALKLRMGMLVALATIGLAQSAQAQFVVASYGPVPVVAGTNYWGGIPTGVYYGGAYPAYYAAPVAYAAPIMPVSYAYAAPVAYPAPIAYVGGPAVIRAPYYGVTTVRYRPWGGVTIRYR